MGQFYLSRNNFVGCLCKNGLNNASAATHHIQAGISNLQEPQDVISIISERTPDFCCAQSVAEVVMPTFVTSVGIRASTVSPQEVSV